MKIWPLLLLLPLCLEARGGGGRGGGRGGSIANKSPSMSRSAIPATAKSQIKSQVRSNAPEKRANLQNRIQSEDRTLLSWKQASTTSLKTKPQHKFFSSTARSKTGFWYE